MDGKHSLRALRRPPPQRARTILARYDPQRRILARPARRHPRVDRARLVLGRSALLTTADPSRRAIVVASTIPATRLGAPAPPSTKSEAPAVAGADSLLLEIEMQSGDTIRIEAAAFSFDSLPANHVREAE